MEEEVRGGWRIFHNEELHNLHFTKHLLRLATKDVSDGFGMQHACERSACKTLVANVKEIYNLGNLV
jgi:hypothetical protein